MSTFLKDNFLNQIAKYNVNKGEQHVSKRYYNRTII